VKKSINRIVMEDMQRTTSITLKTITSWVDGITLDLNYWSTQSICQMALEDTYIGIATSKNLNSVLNKQKRDYKFYDNLNLANVKGDIISSSEEGLAGNINVFNEYFFQNALKGKITVTAKPKAQNTDKNSFIISVPVIINDTISGVLYGAIDLDFVYEMFIKPIKVERTGYAYLVDGNGLFLAHPDKTNILTVNIGTYSWGKKMLEQGNGTIIYSFKGINKIAFFEKEKSIGWIMVIAAPVNELMAPARDIGLINSIITAFFIIIAVISIALLYRTIIQQPINLLIEGIEQFSVGKLNNRIEIHTNDEFQELAGVFNKMTDDLQKVTVSRDELVKEIRERKRTEEMLADRELELRKLFESIDSGVVIYEVVGNGENFIIKDFNAAAERIEKISRQQVIGKVVTEAFPGIKEFGLCEVFKRVWATGNPEYFPETLYKDKRDAGSWRENWVYKLPAGTIVAVYNDITARKLAEEQLQIAFEQLKAAQAQLVQSAKMASVGTLAGGVAHEINNPLTGVLNNVQLIKMVAEQKKEFSIDDFKELLNLIEESALRCTKITRSLLSFSHAPKGVLQDCLLNEMIEKVIVLVEHELILQNISLHIDLDPNLIQTKGDSQLLQQVIFDIITNAKWAIQKKAGKEGGTITIKTKNHPETKSLFLSISDTGLGIPKENLERIFEPFFTTKPVGEGTGLGLSIVYRIIKQHNGTIIAESEEGNGATFKIELPVLV
jgi:signal transduction histidine kinase/methyl-accepting chemotaxis protein